MSFTGKKLFLLVLIGLIALSAVYVLVCTPLCPTVHYGLDFSQGATCTFPSHSFVQIRIGLAALFILPLLGIFPHMKPVPIPEGFLLSLFKPPRFIF